MNLALRPSTTAALNAFRQRRKRLLRVEALLILLVIAGAALSGVAILDRFRLLPDTLRPWLSLAVYVAAGLTAWWLAWSRIRLARHNATTARLMEEAAPALRERLLAAVELEPTSDSARIPDSAEFRSQLQDAVAEEVKSINWNRALPWSLTAPWLRRMGMLLLLIAALAVTPRLHFAGFLARAALPFAALERPSSVRIAIVAPSPADTLAPYVSEIEILADITGDLQKAPVLLEYAETGAPARTVEMARLQDDRFEQRIAIGQSDVRYRIQAADGLTSWQTVSARPRPGIESFEKTLVPPAYTGAQPVTVTDDQGDIEALAGTTVKLRLKSNQPVKDAVLLLNPADANPPAKPAVTASAQDIVSEFVLTPELHSWQTRLVSAETGFTNEESHPWRLTVLEDTPPVVAMTQPADLLQLLPDESLRTAGFATDDVGLKSAELLLSINADAPQSISHPLDAAAKEAELNHLVALSALNLQGGDSLLLSWKVTDLKGQTSESPPVRIVIQEQTVDPRLRAWSDAQQRIATAAKELQAQTRELREAASRVQKNASLARRTEQPANDPEGQLARLKAALESSKQIADDLWTQTQAAARTAPDQLTRQEAALLGERLAKLRRASLPQIAEAAAEPLKETEPIKRAASEAEALADIVRKASELFAAEAAAEVATRSAETLRRQEANLTQNALESNRDSTQRPRWQEQQRAMIASTQALEKDLTNLQSLLPDRGQARSLEEARAQVQETASDLRESLDKPDQKKSPEHLYGAADNLRNRLQKAADQSRAAGENLAQRSAQLREQLLRQDNPALATLDQAKASLEEAARQAQQPPGKRPPPSKDGLTAAQRAEKQLAQAARQLQDQADLQSQTPDPSATTAALNTNRLSRAADQLSRNTAEAAAQPPQPNPPSDKKDPPPATASALAETARQADALSQAARTLQTSAKLQQAAQTLSSASEPNTASPRADAQQLARSAADAQAASESLRQAGETLRRGKDTQPVAALAQQAADLARSGAQQQRDQSRQASQNPEFQSQPVAPTLAAAENARQASEALAPQIQAAEQTLEQLTPAVSQMMRQLAQDLKTSQQQTQQAANQAKAETPVEEVAQQARELQPRTTANAERMDALQSALRQEANQADLTQDDQRQLARSADVALEQMRQKSPQIAGNLKQAAQASQSQPQAQALQNAANAQQQTAESLEQLAENFARMENGESLTAEQLAAMQQMEQELGVQQALNEAYARAEALANLQETAKENPSAALELLEKELAANPTMQKSLADLGQEAAEATEQQLATQANQPAFLGSASEEAAHALQRVARHENRLGQQQAAQTVAQAAQALQKTAQETKTNPGNASPKKSQAATQSSQQASQAAAQAAASTLPTPGATMADQIQATALAQALDQLDQTLNPMASSPGNNPGQQGQQQPSPDGQQGQQQQGGQQQQSAQQNLANASQSQQQSMAQSRNQGQVPGAQPSQQNMAQNSPKPAQNSDPSTDGGNFQMVVKEGDLTGQIIMVPGDWGRLPTRTAEGLTEATRQDAPPEYRAAVENYYKAIATQAKK